MTNNELTHYGVKGMRWGHRTSRGGTPPGRGPKGSRGSFMTPERKAVAKKVAVGTAVTAGVLATAYVMSRNGGVSVSSLSSRFSSAKKVADGLGGSKNAASNFKSGQDLFNEARSRASTQAGKATVNKMKDDVWKKQLADFDKIVKEANDNLYRSGAKDAADAGLPYMTREAFNQVPRR